MEVNIHLYSQSQNIVIADVRNTYQKGSLYCIVLNDKTTVYKFPLEHIFRITETHNENN